MINVIEKTKNNALLSIVLALVVSLLVIELSHLCSEPIANLFEAKYNLNFYTNNVFLKFFMLFFSILFIFLLNGGKLKGFGFVMPTKFRYGKFTLTVISISIASFVFGMVVFIIFLNSLFPVESIGGSTVGFSEGESIVEMILTVWIWSSLCEEVLTRGLLYGTIQHLASKKFLRLSLPVWISGLFFGYMHSRLITFGMSFWFVAFIVFNTTVIGLVAGYYREKSGSLFPAFLAHFLANIVGYFPMIINQIVNS